MNSSILKYASPEKEEKKGIEKYASQPSTQEDSGNDIFASEHMQEVERRFRQGLRAFGSGLGGLPKIVADIPQTAANELYRLFAGEYPTPSQPGTATYETAQNFASPLDFLPTPQDIQQYIDASTGGQYAPQNSQEEFVSQLLTGAGAGAPFGLAGAAFGAGFTQLEPALDYIGAPERVKAGANLLAQAAPFIAKVPRGTKSPQYSAAKLSAYERMGLNPSTTPLFTEEATLSRGQKTAMKTNVAKSAFQKDLKDIGKGASEGFKSLSEKVSSKTFEDLSSQDIGLPIPESLKGTALTEIQNKVSPSESALSSADQVTSAIDSTIKGLRDAARERYQFVDEVAGNEIIDTAPVVRSAAAIKRRLERPGEFKADVTKRVLTSVDNLLKEIAYPTSEGRFVSQEIPISKVTALKQEINRLQNFDVPDQGLKNELGRLGQEMNTLVREKLAENPEALDAYNTAEALWAEQGEKFGTKSPSVYKARFETRAPEEMFNAKNPSEIRDFARALEDTEQGQQAFSSYLKEVMKRNDKASDVDFLQEVHRVVPERFKEAVEDQIKVIEPTSDISIKSRSLDKIRQDVVEGLRVTGELPKYISDYAGTLKGRDTLRKALGNSPEAKQVLQSIDRAYVQKLLDGSLKNDGTLDVKSIKELASNKSTQPVLREIMGQEGVQFMQDLGTIAESVHQVLEKYPNIEKPTNTALDFLAKNAIGILFGGKASKALVGTKLIAQGGKNAYASILLNKKARGAMRDLQKAQKMPDSKAKIGLITGSLKTIQEELGDELE